MGTLQMLMQKSTGMVMPFFQLFFLGLEQASKNTGGPMKQQLWRIYFILCRPGL